MVYWGQVQMQTPSANHKTNQALCEQVETAVQLIKNGGLVAIPTDTLYGLAASVFSEQAVKRVYQIKGRPTGMALPILLSDPDQIRKYAINIPGIVWNLVDQFLPGSLTLILEKSRNIPDFVTGGLNTVAVRVPDHWIPREISRRLGIPITGTSANNTGEPGLTTAQTVWEQLGNGIDLVVDSNEHPTGIASTILDMSGSCPTIVREGFISRKYIESVCDTTIALAKR